MSSSLRIIRDAFVPGYVDLLKKDTDHLGNEMFSGLTKAIQSLRKSVYVAVALTAIAASGAAVSAGPMRFCCLISCLAATEVTIFGLKHTYRMTELLHALFPKNGAGNHVL